MLGGMGIETGKVEPNFQKMQKAKDNAVKSCNKNVKNSFVKLGIDHLNGWGKFTSPNDIQVNLNYGGEETINAKNIIIATGSNPNELGSLPMDEEVICSSSGALEQKEIPERMFIYGGGIVGIEIGSVYQRLGTEVTVVQRGDRICQFLDPDVGKLFLDTLQAQGIKFLCNTEIIDAIKMRKGGLFVNLKDRLSQA